MSKFNIIDKQLKYGGEVKSGFNYQLPDPILILNERFGEYLDCEPTTFVYSVSNFIELNSDNYKEPAFLHIGKNIIEIGYRRSILFTFLPCVSHDNDIQSLFFE